MDEVPLLLSIRGKNARGTTMIRIVAAMLATSFQLAFSTSYAQASNQAPEIPLNQSGQSVDASPSMAETVEYIDGKLSSCWPSWGIEVSDGRMTAANFSAVHVDRGRASDTGRDGGMEWEFHPYPARIEVELSDLSTEVAEPISLPTGPEGYGPLRDGGYKVSMRCMKPGCIRALDYEEDGDGQEFEDERGFGFAFWERQREWWNFWVFRDYQISTAVNVIAAGQSLQSHDFALCDLDSANRVRRALIHLITLGGGQAELF